MALRDLHRTSAAVIGVFAVVHIANHLVSMSGVPAHIAFMAAARSVYRELAVESLLLFCVAFQIASGLWLVVRGWRQRAGAVAWLQAISGTYLAFFFLVHIAAILFGRSVLGLDTNFYYAPPGSMCPRINCSSLHTTSWGSWPCSLTLGALRISGSIRGAVSYAPLRSRCP